MKIQHLTLAIALALAIATAPVVPTLSGFTGNEALAQEKKKPPQPKPRCYVQSSHVKYNSRSGVGGDKIAKMNRHCLCIFNETKFNWGASEKAWLSKTLTERRKIKYACADSDKDYPHAKECKDGSLCGKVMEKGIQVAQEKLCPTSEEPVPCKDPASDKPLAAPNNSGNGAVIPQNGSPDSSGGSSGQHDDKSSDALDF